MDRREGEVKVRWADWNGPEEWVRLADNPELQSFLTHSRAAPDIDNVAQPYEVAALRQAIFESLGGARFTGDGSMGIQSRVSVKVPFPRRVFDATFGKLCFADIPVSKYISIEDVSKAIGQGWSLRNHHTPTETLVSAKHAIHLSYRHKNLVQHSHEQCKRSDNHLDFLSAIESSLNY